jgi:hypothetical protein
LHKNGQFCNIEQIKQKNAQCKQSLENSNIIKSKAVENIVRGVEFPLNPPCKRRIERTYKRTTKG